MIPNNRSEVFSLAGSWLQFLKTTFSYLNLRKTSKSGTTSAYHFANAKCYAADFLSLRTNTV